VSKEKATAWVRLTPTRAGRIGLAASERGLVLSTLPGRRDASPRRDVPLGPIRGSAPPAAVAELLDAAEEALGAYFAAWPDSPGPEAIERLWAALLGLRVDLEGLPAFTRRVLELLREVRPGRVVTYGQLAARAGSPGAARAVGCVMARNPLPTIIPCHRVIASDGTLGGFAGRTRGEALAFKESLLRYEGWVPARSVPRSRQLPRS